MSDQTARTLTLEQLTDLRHKTEIVSKFLQEQLQAHLETLRPVLALDRVFGRYAGGRTDTPMADRVFAELQQVALNFMVNAEQAVLECTPPRHITIKLTGGNGRARLEVRDNGNGVPPENEAKLFQPFFTTKPVGQGTGLGLSLCHGIVESHGGSLSLVSEPGRGAMRRSGAC